MRWLGFYEMPKKDRQNGRHASYACKDKESSARCQAQERKAPVGRGLGLGPQEPPAIRSVFSTYHDYHTYHDYQWSAPTIQAAVSSSPRMHAWTPIWSLRSHWAKTLGQGNSVSLAHNVHLCMLFYAGERNPYAPSERFATEQITHIRELFGDTAEWRLIPTCTSRIGCGWPCPSAKATFVRPRSCANSVRKAVRTGCTWHSAPWGHGDRSSVGGWERAWPGATEGVPPATEGVPPAAEGPPAGRHHRHPKWPRAQILLASAKES